ncbi:hypothetical protein [Kitasatospora sp. NPDC086791]|uniref:hypothetical protein n=1 Tax=Kitasatospora sp. NPDC086791 TaxID=3155178 RepID=UPI00342E6ACF
MHAHSWPKNPTFGDQIKLRRRATNETHQTARQELRDNPELIPNPAPGQVPVEAAVFAALIREYGFHWPSSTGGPYGIKRLTPRRDELVLHVERTQLARWAAALATTKGSTGVPGLEWTGDGKDTVLTQSGGRIVLARSSERDWHKALDQAAAVPRPTPRQRDRELSPGTDHQVHWPAERLQPLNDQLSATLRRIHLLTKLSTYVRTVDLSLHEHAGHLYLADRSLPSVAPIWISTGVPFPLWPTASTGRVRPVSPHARVLSLVTQFSEAAPPEDPAHALCILASFPDSSLARRAAEHALQHAKMVLENPTYASLYDGGGWIGQCITVASDTPLDAGHKPIWMLPETESLLDRFSETEELGKLSPDFTEAEDRRDPETAGSRGNSALQEMLNWALAAATRPAGPERYWRRGGGIWTAQLNGGQETIRAEVDRNADYQIHLLWAGLPDDNAIVKEKTHHVAASVLAAEYMGITATIADPFKTEAGNRLANPQDIQPDADPLEAELILAAPYTRILDITGLAGVLTFIDHRVGETPGAAAGHLTPGTREYDSDQHYMNSLTSWFMEYGGIPATRRGEAANTASVDSPEFRRHLARHRAALDPFTACYLAAADRDPQLADFADRHAAGVRALRAAGFDELLARDPRQLPDAIAKFAAAIPEDVDRLRQWANEVPRSS